jgi:hypothetical protein
VKEELTEEQRIAARLIAVKTPFVKVARELGIGVSVLSRWRKSPLFKERIAELEQEAESGQEEETDSMVAQGRELLPQALQSLRDLLDSQSDPTRLGAVRLVVQICKQSQVSKNKGVTMNEAVFEAATQMLVELFNRREDLKKEALIELERIRHSEDTVEEELDK